MFICVQKSALNRFDNTDTLSYFVDFETIVSIICLLLVLTALSAILQFCVKCKNDEYNTSNDETHHQTPNKRKKKSRSKGRGLSACRRQQSAGCMQPDGGFVQSERGVMPKVQGSQVSFMRLLPPPKGRSYILMTPPVIVKDNL